MTTRPVFSTGGMFDRRGFLVGSALIGGGIPLSTAFINASPRDPPSSLADRVPTPRFREENNPATIASAKGLCFGTCLSIAPLRNNPAYIDLAARYSNCFVHASALQWHELQRTRKAPYAFGAADTILSWSRKQGKRFRGHMMLDWAGLPAWVEPSVSRMHPAEAEAFLRSHVRRIGERYRGKVIQWNVANEPMRGPSVRSYCWHDKLGEAYIDIAFDETTKADPGVPLAINQNLIEMVDRYQQRTRDGLLELVHRLKSRGVAISSVGIEGHLLSQFAVDQYGLDAFARALASMDIRFMITEMDVDDRAFNGTAPQRDAASAALVREFLDVMLVQPNCEGLMFWGMTDAYHWLVRDKKRARADNQPQRPAPFDTAGNPKPMWQVTIDALRRAPGPSSGSLLKTAKKSAP